MSRLVTENTFIEGLQIIQRQLVSDPRGFLDRLFCTDELEPLISGFVSPPQPRVGFMPHAPRRDGHTSLAVRTPERRGART